MYVVAVKSLIVLRLNHDEVRKCHKEVFLDQGNVLGGISLFLRKNESFENNTFTALALGATINVKPLFSSIDFAIMRASVVFEIFDSSIVFVISITNG